MANLHPKVSGLYELSPNIFITLHTRHYYIFIASGQC